MNIFNSIAETIKTKRGYFCFLITLTICSIILGILAGVNISGGILVVDLSNIAYIQFLTGNCGFMPMIFKLGFSVFIFFALIHLCHIKQFLTPLAILFFVYFVYSQTVVLVTIILLYGFWNCVILSLLLLIYIVINFAIFILLCLELNKHCNCPNYFASTLNLNNSTILFYLIGLMLICIVFCIILAILKNFVILLVY